MHTSVSLLTENANKIRSVGNVCKEKQKHPSGESWSDLQNIVAKIFIDFPNRHFGYPLSEFGLFKLFCFCSQDSRGEHGKGQKAYIYIYIYI